MKVFGTDNEYFLGDREDMDIDEAQELASTKDEDQDEDPETSKEEVAAIYAMTGMDPAAWSSKARQ